MACHVAGVRLAPQAAACQAWLWWQRKTWRQACALGLSTTYAALFLLASLCLATGFLHTDISPDHHQHHTHHDTALPSALPDICDVVLQVLMTTELQTSRPPSSIVPPGATLALAPAFSIATAPALSHSVRAPPASLS